MFARNEREYRLTSKNNRWWLLLILLLSVASITMYECVEKKSIFKGCNIWMICLELNWSFYDPSRTLQLSEFVWTLRSSVWVVSDNFLLEDTTDRIYQEVIVVFLNIKSFLNYFLSLLQHKSISHLSKVTIVEEN